MQPRKGMTLINKGGDIKEVASHLAYDPQLQRQHNFFPCDEKGNPIPQNQSQEVVVLEEKKSQAAVVAEVKIEIPAGSDIVNPLEEENEQVEEPVVRNKPGRKPVAKTK